MINNGSIVTLTRDKEHDSLRIEAGICGMIVYSSLENGRELYTVDFGPDGQWYCNEDELNAEGSIQEAPMVTHDPNRFRRMREDVLTYRTGYGNDDDEDKSETEEIPTIDIEADIKKRMKELEQGAC